MRSGHPKAQPKRATKKLTPSPGRAYGAQLFSASLGWLGRFRRETGTGRCLRRLIELVDAMKVRNSLKSLRGRHRDNRLVRRKGRVYVINKTNRRFKARQG